MAESFAKKMWRTRKKNQNAKRVEVFLEEEEFLAVKAYAVAHGVTVAELIRTKLKEGGVYSQQVFAFGGFHDD
ncbi:MAG: hypothetical protein WA056_02215 [Gallionella sp.]